MYDVAYFQQEVTKFATIVSDRTNASDYWAQRGVWFVHFRETILKFRGILDMQDGRIQVLILHPIKWHLRFQCPAKLTQ